MTAPSLISKQGRSLVVLMHGFLGSRVQLLPMAAALAPRHAILNYGYRSRQDTLRGHAASLADAVHARLQRGGGVDDPKPSAVHFVTHSYGGAVLVRALASGLADGLPGAGGTRCVLLAPPLRGASLARAFASEGEAVLAAPSWAGGVIQATADAVLGGKAGAELQRKDGEWFAREVGHVPDEVEVLVVAGVWARSHAVGGRSLGRSDGIVAEGETRLGRRHYRVEVELSHNVLLLSKEVIRCTAEFLDGRPVGSEVLQ